MSLRTCADCMHWQAPHSRSKNEKSIAYGSCSMLAVDPVSRKVMPESEIDRRDLWRTDPFRTAANFNACRGWAPADRRKTKPELTVIVGGRTA